MHTPHCTRPRQGRAGSIAYTPSRQKRETSLSALKEHFPDTWQAILCLTYGRLVYQSPLKNMSFHYANSYLSVQYPDIDL
ncbi:MAG: hypothetical protein LBF89_04105, partial [Bacteroidales bacterium]|nr:hypothetical protein [Bacteroidales bacterium]